MSKAILGSISHNVVTAALTAIGFLIGLHGLLGGLAAGYYFAREAGQANADIREITEPKPSAHFGPLKAINYIVDRGAHSIIQGIVPIAVMAVVTGVFMFVL